MSADTVLLRSETRTDYLGEYVAYVYGDGHVESDPPGRPVYKEDYQRRRAIDLSASNVREALASARIAAATGRAHLNRDQSAAAVTATLLDEVRKTLKAIGTVVDCTATPVKMMDELVTNADVGGTLVPANGIPDGEVPEELDSRTDLTLRELR